MLLRLFSVWTATVLKSMGAKRRVFETGDVRLAYYEVGSPDGEPWILLHGLGSTALSWNHVVRRMRKDARLIVPELSSLGGTQCPGGGLNVPEGARSIRDLIGALVPEQSVTLAGISLGGWMAVKLAIECPQLVERLVLIDAAGYEDQDWERIRDMTDIRDLEGVDRFYGALFARTPFILDMSRRGFLKAYTSSAVQRVLGTTEPDHAYGPEHLAAVRAPTLLIWGEKDGLFFPEVAHSMRRHLPSSELVMIQDAGHAVQWETPKEMAHAMLRFRESGLSGFAAMDKSTA